MSPREVKQIDKATRHRVGYRRDGRAQGHHRRRHRHARRTPRWSLLQQVLDRLNDLFGAEDFTESQKVSWLEGLLQGPAGRTPTLVKQAKVNSKKQFLESPDFDDAVVGAVADNQGAHNKMADYFTSTGEVEVFIVESLGELVHVYAQDASA